MSEIFEISTRWQDGAIQCLIYGAVLLAICWTLSKINLPDRGEFPSGEEEGER